jgi:hypothetical protein
MQGRQGHLRIATNLYTGMPQAQITDPTGGRVQLEPLVELKSGEHFNVDLAMSDPLARRLAQGVRTGKVSISLPSLDVDLQHNQSFGMVSASTGCISNPGGPSC